jgi:SAM-dependent methyltransferase
MEPSPRRWRRVLLAREFSWPVAVGYEAIVAESLAQIVGPHLAPALVGPMMLDVGCGGGSLARHIANEVQGDVVGVDPSRSQIVRFRRRSAATRTRAVRAVAETLPFRDGRFDSCYSTFAWKHWTDPAASLSEMIRVTRSGGTIIVVEIDGDVSRSDFDRFAEKTRIPVALRASFVRFNMLGIVAVAPSRTTMAASFENALLRDLKVERIESAPFLMASGIRK